MNPRAKDGISSGSVDLVLALNLFEGDLMRARRKLMRRMK
jgi:hypothetical protein